MNVVISLTAVLIFMFLINFIFIIQIVKWYNKIIKLDDNEDGVALFIFGNSVFIYLAVNIGIITSLTANA